MPTENLCEDHSSLEDESSEVENEPRPQLESESPEKAEENVVDSGPIIDKDDGIDRLAGTPKVNKKNSSFKAWILPTLQWRGD